MAEKSWDLLWRNAALATMSDGGASFGLIRDAAVALRDGRIAWCGPVELMDQRLAAAAVQVQDVQGRLVTPGLIDCHTHLVYAGHRSGEFAARLAGDSYAQIARRGGGIVATVAATRAADDYELLRQSLPRALALAGEGVTTVEIKSGYGLTLAAELRMLRVAGQVAQRAGLHCQRTFLGAHALPPEYANNRSGYVELLCTVMLPAVATAGLAEAVDAFCEAIAFTPAEVRRIFVKARELGLARRLHADQLSDLGGAALAAELAALSADHLEFTSTASVQAMAGAGTVAVLLPAAFYCMRETRVPPIAALRAAGVPLAVATDCNPGSSPCASLLTAMHMGCVLLGLTPMEALHGATTSAAAALGLQHDRGRLAAGLRADLALWDVDDPLRLVLELGAHRPVQVLRDGIARG